MSSSVRIKSPINLEKPDPISTRFWIHRFDLKGSDYARTRVEEQSTALWPASTMALMQKQNNANDKVLARIVRARKALAHRATPMSTQRLRIVRIHSDRMRPT